MFGFLPPLFLLISALFPIIPPDDILPEIEMPEITHVIPTPKLTPPPDISITPIPIPEYSKDKLMPRPDEGEREYEEPQLPEIPAYNLSSEKEMPTPLPQIAVDNSPALEPSSSPGFVGDLGRYEEPDIPPILGEFHGGGSGQASGAQTGPGHTN